MHVGKTIIKIAKDQCIVYSCLVLVASMEYMHLGYVSNNYIDMFVTIGMCYFAISLIDLLCGRHKAMGGINNEIR